jgi:hypothetical protein
MIVVSEAEMGNYSHQLSHYVLRSAMRRHIGDLSISHRWLNEFDRWKELVFSIFARISQVNELRLRDIVDDLASTGLLDIENLANADDNSELLRNIGSILMLSGFSKDETVSGVNTVRQVATGLNKHFAGKIQVYLRRYGNQIIDEAHEFFEFRDLDESQYRYILTYWLQNVLDMPLSLEDEFVGLLCDKYHIDPADIFKAADDLDINMAFVDDIALREVSVLGMDITKKLDDEE